MKAFLKALNITPYSVLFNALFFAGMFLTLWELDVYKKTIIDYRIATSLWVGPGVLLTPVLRKTLTLHISTRSLFLQLIYNIVTWGGIVVFTFMATNFYFSKQSVMRHTFAIKEIGSIPGGRNHCREPYAVIEWNDTEKEISFPCGTDLKNADLIKLELKNGFLGYDIIIHKKLIKVGDAH